MNSNLFLEAEMDREKSFPAARSCDCCESAAALVFCRSDGAFMCMRCDSRLHNCGERHERVWVCEVCEQVPAVVACKADAAVLCFACDQDIHSVNPLARKHDRTPVVPLYDTAESLLLKSADATPLLPVDGGGMGDCFSTGDDSWNMPNDSIVAAKLLDDCLDVKPNEFLFSDSDHFLDFDFYRQVSSRFLSDGVVPDHQTIMTPPIPTSSISQPQSSGNRFEIDFARSGNINSYSYTTSSLSHDVSSSSMDLGGVVPDRSALSDASYPLAMSMNHPMVDLNGSQGFPAAGTDREARVLRYKEKRKSRKFQKTVRYASRKAYAEMRPRIKGRFAKRTDDHSEIDPVFMTTSPEFISHVGLSYAMSF